MTQFFIKVLGNFYITCGRCSTWRSELVLVTFLYQLYLGTQLKSANEEPRNLKQYLKSQCNFGDTTKNEVNKKPWKYLSGNFWTKRT